MRRGVGFLTYFPLLFKIIIISLIGIAAFIAITPKNVMTQGSVKYIEIILDGSRSTNHHLRTGESKIAAIKRAVKPFIEGLNKSVYISLRVFGNRPDTGVDQQDETLLLTDFTPVPALKKDFFLAIDTISGQGTTPLTRVLNLASRDFPTTRKIDRIVILVSDGGETGTGDPCAAAINLGVNTDTFLTIHTIGLDVDEATQNQLECIAHSTGGQYFPALSYEDLVQALTNAARMARLPLSPKEGYGWLKVEDSSREEHIVTNAWNNKKVGTISSMKSVIKVPAGIYNVTMGNGVWKSVEVNTGNRTVLLPGRLRVADTLETDYSILEMETGMLMGTLKKEDSVVALKPGWYEVAFGGSVWPVKIDSGQEICLRPGFVAVEQTEKSGYAILDHTGKRVGFLNASQSRIALPPGEYTVKTSDKISRFSLGEGQNLVLSHTL